MSRFEGSERYPGRALSPIVISDHVVQGDQGGIPVREYRPAGTARAGLLWVHGGSFVEGDVDMPESHEVARALAQSGVWVVASDYRKAIGGVTYPAPVDDVEASWGWYSARASEQGIPHGTLHLGGASAGACIAASVALRRVVDGSPSPASLVLAYPLLHPSIPRMERTAAAMLATIPDAVEFSPSDVLAMALNYVGDARLLTDGAAFPGLTHLAGLPMTLILTSEHDSLRHSGERFFSSARRAGVRAEYYCEPGAAHGHLGARGSAQFGRSIARIVQWVLQTDPTRAWQ